MRQSYRFALLFALIYEVLGFGSYSLAQTPASDVTFTQTGPGSVPTTLQQKLQENISVFDKMTATQISNVQACTYQNTNDATAIQNAIDSLPPNGGTVFVPPGCYKLTSTVMIGNGGSAASTVNGIRLVGQGMAWGFSSTKGSAQGGSLPVVFKLFGTAHSGEAIAVNGPITGCGASNIDFEFDSTVGPVARAISDTGCIYGLFENLVVNQPSDYGIIDSTSAIAPADHNVWRNIFVRLGNSSPNAQGILITGNPQGGDRFFDRWDTVRIVMSSQTQFAMHLQYCDSTVITSVEIPTVTGGSAVGVLFDYSAVTNFPNDTVIQAIDPYGNIIENTGVAPTGSTLTNRIFGLLQGNGALIPKVTNLTIINN